ncbi:Uncharacterised protein [Sphingobacterium multivorum]|uniref:hypothetical protein n=1 Tax=Sphingobacterium multivorum TaxID=28454 RepID=UPI000DFADF12|nr:hypothetical protein [Sphingobacterium multivorum]QQT43333.1 hypothetical protein I6J00_16435 [Sphingobacterium multivorum]SUI98667.1 Uncharacterised protein [Sphingobacterium multivorum]
MTQEQPYFDENGIEIKEFALIRVFHFIGARRKKHYMYKWVKLKEHKGTMYWVAYHLENATESIHGYYHLRHCANEDRVIKGTVILQQQGL